MRGGVQTGAQHPLLASLLLRGKDTYDHSLWFVFGISSEQWSCLSKNTVGLSVDTSIDGNSSFLGAHVNKVGVVAYANPCN